MDDPLGSPSPPRLNLFALPSRTTLLFLLIVTVIYLPLLAALNSTSAVCAPFLLFWMIALPLRHFFREPERVIKTQQLVAAEPNDSSLTKMIAQDAQTIARIETPRVMVSARATDVVWTFGTFRRAYLAFSDAMAQELGRLLQQGGAAAARSRAIVLHELAHFRHNDVWLASLARSVLVVTIGFMTLSLLVHFLTPFLYYRFLTFFDFTQSPFAEIIAPLARDNPEILGALDPNNPIVAARWVDYLVAIFSSFVPLIVGSVLLLIFFWSALMRTRELYADARVVEWQNGNSESLWEGLTVATTVKTLQSTSSNWREKTWTECSQRIERWRNGLRFGEKSRFTRLQTWLSPHPNESQRDACLQEPYKVYGDELSIALTAGAAVVLLNFNLLSYFYSATLRGPNSVPAFALSFTVISLSLLPYLCQFKGKLRALFCRVKKIVFIFTGIKLIPQAVGAVLLTYVALVDPSILQRSLEASVRSDLPAGFANELTGLLLENFVIRPAILFAFGMPLFLIAYLFLDVWLKRKMLYWFGFDFLARHSAFVFAYSTAILALVLIFVILPIVDWVAIPSAHDPLEPAILVPMIVVALIAIVHLILFGILNRRYARQCPQCNARVMSEYELGMRCNHCNATLNGWLVSNQVLPASSK